MTRGGSSATGKEKVAGTGGDKYIPPEQRQGNESVVYFTRDLSAAGLLKIYETIAGNMTGRVGIKLHTDEPHGPNIIPRPWVKQLMEAKLPNAKIVETNTYYGGARYTTEEHRKTLAVNGWDFAPVDILDEEGTTMLPVKGGQWGIDKEEFMERLTESSKATADHFGSHIAYINVLRNMSVSCDCEGTGAQPVVTPNIGILASTDILAADRASVDLVYALPEKDRHALVERMKSHHGLRQLSYMKELGMGCDRYVLLDLDHGSQPLTLADAVKDVKPFEG